MNSGGIADHHPRSIDQRDIFSTMVLHSQPSSRPISVTAHKFPLPCLPHRNQAIHYILCDAGNRWKDTMPHPIFELHRLHIQEKRRERVEDEPGRHLFLPTCVRNLLDVNLILGS